MSKVYDAKMFEAAPKDELLRQELGRPPVNFWKDAWRRFRKNRGALVGLVVITVILILAVFGPYMTGYNAIDQDLTKANQGVSAEHWFGTDNLGRDLWTRTWDGAKVSLLIAFLAAAINVVIGVTIGGISGYFGGKVDLILQRFIEIMYSIPNLVIIILMLLYFEPGIVPIALALAITEWVPMARIVRAQTLKLKTQEYVLAARTLGASHRRVLVKHLVPNVMGPIIIAITFSIPSAIFFEAFLSFIGLGLRPPDASLGVLVNAGAKTLQIFPEQILFPAGVLSLIMLSFNLLGDGLRDALDPKMRK